MIKTKKGDTKIKGTVEELMADVSMIIYTLYENISEDLGKRTTKARLKHAFKRGLLIQEVSEEIENYPFEK